jgi:hypothetical protein
LGYQARIEGNYGSITDIPLDNTENLRCFWRAWYYMQEAKYANPGVQVLVMEMKQMYYSARLSSKHRDAILLHLVQEKTQNEAAAEMGVSPRSISRLVDQALEAMVAYIAPTATPATPPATLQAIPA